MALLGIAYTATMEALFWKYTTLHTILAQEDFGPCQVCRKENVQ